MTGERPSIKLRGCDDSQRERHNFSLLRQCAALFDKLLVADIQSTDDTATVMRRFADPRLEIQIYEVDRQEKYQSALMNCLSREALRGAPTGCFSWTPTSSSTFRTAPSWSVICRRSARMRPCCPDQLGANAIRQLQHLRRDPGLLLERSHQNSARWRCPTYSQRTTRTTTSMRAITCCAFAYRATHLGPAGPAAPTRPHSLARALEVQDRCARRLTNTKHNRVQGRLACRRARRAALYGWHRAGRAQLHSSELRGTDRSKSAPSCPASSAGRSSACRLMSPTCGQRAGLPRQLASLSKRCAPTRCASNQTIRRFVTVGVAVTRARTSDRPQPGVGQWACATAATGAGPDCH